MSTLVRNTRRTPTGASALWMGLLAVITSTFLTVGAFLWLAQDDPHPTSATAARNAASIRAANEQHVRLAEQRARAAMARRAGELAAYIRSRRAGARPFAEDMVSLYGKWRAVKGWLPFTDTNGHRAYVEERFAFHVMSPAQLAAAVEQTLKNARGDLEAIENELAVQLRQELLGRPLTAGEAAAARADFDNTLKRLTDAAQRQAALSAGGLAVAEGAAQIGSQVLVRLGVSAGLLAAGASNAWWSLGAGLVIGFAVDAAWDQITDPAGDIGGKTAQGLDDMAGQSSQVVQDALLKDLSHRNTLWKRSIDGSTGS